MSWARNGGNRIWWDESGEGEPLLLAMGHAWDSRMWWPAMPALSARYRVIRFDNRGIGRTEWDGAPFGIEDLAADAFAVLDEAGVDRAHVYGMSMGGLTVQEMALSRPERIRSLVLGCTAAFDETPRGSWADGLRARIPFVLTTRLFRSALYGPDADPASIAEDLRLMREANLSSTGRLAQIKAVGRFHSRSRVGGISAPCLVVHGALDKAVAVAEGSRLAELVPGAELVVMPRAGHAYLADRGTAATDAVLDFLSRHSGDRVT